MRQELKAQTIMYLKDYISAKNDNHILQNRLSSMDDSVYEQVFTLKLVNPLYVLLFGIFLGCFGVDRFITKNYLLGALRIILTIVGFMLFIIGLTFTIPFVLLDEELGLKFVYYFMAGSLVLTINYIWILVDVCTSYPRVYRKNFKQVTQMLDRESNL